MTSQGNSSQQNSSPISVQTAPNEFSLKKNSASAPQQTTQSKNASTQTPIETPAIELYFNDPISGLPLMDQMEKQANGLDTHLVNFIDEAQKSLDIAFYDLGLSSVVQAINNAHQRGVTVRVVAEEKNKEDFKGLQIDLSSITYKGEDCEKYEGIEHNKFVVRDGKEVWTGSYNPTSRATYYYGS